ncbi:TPA: hypothetical protein ACPJZX_004416 [Vibrio diabolicus]
MSELHWTLLIGICSSLAATFIFIGLSELTTRWLIPSFKDFVYSGVRIDGDWVYQTPSSEASEVDIVLTLNQKAGKVSGSLMYAYGDRKTDFDLNGEIHNMIFSATAVAKSRRHVDASSMLLHIDQYEGSLRLTGAFSAVERVNKIVSFENVMFVERRS